MLLIGTKVRQITPVSSPFLEHFPSFFLRQHMVLRGMVGADKTIVWWYCEGTERKHIENFKKKMKNLIYLLGQHMVLWGLVGADTVWKWDP